MQNLKKKYIKKDLHTLSLIQPVNSFDNFSFQFLSSLLFMFDFKSFSEKLSILILSMQMTLKYWEKVDVVDQSVLAAAQCGISNFLMLFIANYWTWSDIEKESRWLMTKFNIYFRVPNKRVGWNKHVGRTILTKLINM